MLLAVALAFSLIGALGTVVARQASALATQLPVYEATVTAKWAHLSTSPLVHTLLGKADGPADTHGSEGVAARLGLDGSSTLDLAKQFAQPLLSPLATVGIVLVFSLFILLYNEDLRDRFVRLVGPAGPAPGRSWR